MVFNTERKTIHWEFIKSLEPARVTHMRAVEVISKNNYFAQITVRFHTQQVGPLNWFKELQRTVI
jgi:hypothetical protein